MNIDIRNGDCLELLKTIPDNSVDAVITDPPYTDGKGNDVLGKHKIQTKLNIDMFFTECFRILKEDSFIAFFGQMPTILTWHDAAIKAGFEWKIDIVWSKVNPNVFGGKLKRVHEFIWVYKKGNPKFNEVRGDWQEVSQSLCMQGLKNIESIFRNLSYWKGIAQGKELVSARQYIGKTNDAIYDFGSKGYKFERAEPMVGKETMNLTTVWAFLTHNAKHRNPITGQIKHPTVKPIPCLEHLVELLTIENQIVIDPFLGSGTTGIACANLKRSFIGFELDKDYFEIAKKRINFAVQKQNEKLF